jgi:glycine/D-amino acid oxidase-like deaminating enzyme
MIRPCASALSADVAVIGGGIAGLMTAWFLAEEGADVVLIEARDLGTQASGANAGSIHLQIQYPEFVAYGESWARAYAPCLTFLRESLAMWQELPARVGEDLDVKLAGGLVVATTDVQMRHIEAKARIEAGQGVRWHPTWPTTPLARGSARRRARPTLCARRPRSRRRQRVRGRGLCATPR